MRRTLIKSLPAVFALLTFATAGPRTSRDLARIIGARREDARRLERTGALVNYFDGAGAVAEASAAQQAQLKNLGYPVQVLIPDITGIYQKNLSTPAADGRYLTFQEFCDTMEIIARANPHICRLETLGLSFRGNPLLGMKISDNPQVHEPEPAVHFEGGIHGDEKIGAAITFELLKYLVRNYPTDTLVTRLVDTREIYLLPIYNPDGYIGNSRYNGNGVDLNRNWGWMWGDEANPGDAPFSEPENRAVLSHILRHPAVTFVSYHAGTTFISHPWSYCYAAQNTIPELSLIQFLSARYDSYTHYTYGQGADSMYPINGSTKDFDYGYGMMGWSIEVHMQKTPPASAIDPTFNLNLPAMLALIHHSGQGIHGRVTDAVTGEPVPCQIWVDPAHWPSYNNPELGDFHRFYLPGTYSVTFRAPGYRETTLTDVCVPDSADSLVNLDVRLTPDPAVPVFGFRLISNTFVDPRSNRSYPVAALGFHDDQGFRLDNEKEICLDMGRPVYNYEGPDLAVYRAAGSGSATIQGANGFEGPWSDLGIARADVTPIDISSAGLDSIRYLRVLASGEFHLDAIEGIAPVGLNTPLSGARNRSPELQLASNPATAPVRIFTDPAAFGKMLAIYDRTGRMVNALVVTGREVLWDGRGCAGEIAPPGVYFARLANARTVRFLFVR